VVDGGDSEVIAAKTQTLIQASMKLGEAMYNAQQNTGEGPASDDDAAHAAGGENVVDAEFEEVDGDDHKKSA
jgi:molecular chaperone DnaK